MKRFSLLSLIAVLVLTACASSGARHDDGLAKGSDKLARYQPYVSEPVSQFNMYSSFDGWSDVDNEHVIIHTNVNESYLLTVAPVCIDLPFATRIGVVSRFPNTVSSGFDSLRVGRENCRILEIRPVNYKKMQADLRAEKKLKAASKG
jgi:hypothetical protein